MLKPHAATIAATTPPPVMEARRWLAGVSVPADRPLLNLSQAAPVAPPPPELRKALADAVEDDSSHLYGPVLGLPALRAELAARWSAQYGGHIAPEDVAITSGCNQAFAAAMSTIAAPGEAVILPTPWYFNHKMWLDMQGITTIPLPCGAGMLPDLAEAEAAITPKTRAIVLVSPNNPTGAEYPPALLAGFVALARAHGLALVVDETYRDFHSRQHPVHTLFADETWRDVLVHLYSFSKVFRLTGHRVGALVASPARLAEAEKFLDTVAICPNQLGQRAALYGLQNLQGFIAEERAETLRRRAVVEAGFAALPGWHLLCCGAYFAYVRYDMQIDSPTLAQRLVAEASLLVLPGTMFAPKGEQAAKRQLRIAFANANTQELAVLFACLAAFDP